MKRCLWFLFCIAVFVLTGEVSAAKRGIIVAASERYVEDLVYSLGYLREILHCKLPIEVWHAGGELSSKSKRRLSNFGPIVFRDIKKILGAMDTNYRGFQIKSHMLYATTFEEVILMDADVYFYQDPAILFKNGAYKKTGAYFFRDRPMWKFPPRAYTDSKYVSKRAFIRSLIKEPSQSLPEEWKHYWLSDNDPIFEDSLIKECQESGCVAFNKKKHKNGLINIVRLNLDRAVTYTHVWGDKETFWLGLEMAEEPYSVNDSFPWSIHHAEKDTDIIHFLGDKLFYQQKEPLFVDEESYFYRESLSRKLTEGEQNQINRLFFHRLNAKWNF